MPPFQEFDVWVEIEGTRAAEFALETTRDLQNLPVLACWISSELGKTFTIHLSDDRKSTDAEFLVYVDGAHTGGRILRQTRTQAHRGICTSPGTIKPYMFTRVDLTDDDGYLNRNIPEGFGQIEVRVSRVRVVGPSRTGIAFTAPEEHKVHEKAKKAIVQQVGFGAPIQSAVAKSARVQLLSSVATFVFKYRTLDQLMALDIAPTPARHSPEPPAPDAKKRKRVEKETKPNIQNDVLELSDSDTDEIRDLQEKLDAAKARKNSNKKVKREKVKREPIVGGGDFIDLTL
ncbi:hypothetical protein C8J56DRAFT_928938 [Mycena floridula]|nr:hypothetical protein C8J56DRAFT_928938 [Mycena floridula]